jgi:hypothetical protein
MILARRLLTEAGIHIYLDICIRLAINVDTGIRREIYASKGDAIFRPAYQKLSIVFTLRHVVRFVRKTYVSVSYSIM